MDEFVYKITLDLNCAKTPPVICSGQFDKGRKFDFTITANGEPFDVTGCSAVLKGVRTDGSHFAVDCTVSDGKIIKTLDDTTLSVRGKTVAKLVISDSEKSYSTQMFIIDVDSALDGDITVTDDYSILNRLIEQIHALNESGAIIIDDAIDKDSNNAVANKAVAIAIENSTADLKTAVNPQSKSVAKEVSTSNTSGYFVEISDTKWLKNTLVQIKLIDENSLIGGNVQLQYYSSSNSYIKIATAVANEVVTYMLPEDTDKIRCYIPPSAVTGNGNVNLNVEYLGVLGCVGQMKDDINAVESSVTDINAILLPQSKSVAKEVSTSTTSGYFVEISDTKWLKNTLVQIKLIDENSLINGNVQLQYYSSSDGYIKIATVVANEIVTYMLPEDTDKIRCYIPPSAVVGNGEVSFSVEYLGIINSIANISKKADLSEKISGKAFSVVGDSYSAYKSWIPSGRGYWYTSSQDTQTTDRVDSVTQMWWYILSEQTKMSLLCNDSYSGSTICTTGYNGADVTSSAMVTRIAETLGIDKVTLPKPDFVCIFGGTNDSWAKSPIGEVKYSDWTTDDLKSVLPAFCYLLDYVKLYNPHATIINIVNAEDIATDIATGMATACEYYGAVNIELTGISKEAGHPTAAGQATIAEQLISTLKSIL